MLVTGCGVVSACGEGAVGSCVAVPVVDKTAPDSVRTPVATDTYAIHSDRHPLRFCDELAAVTGILGPRVMALA